MSIEVTTIPKEPQWEDIVIDTNKDFNWNQISRLNIDQVGIGNVSLNTSLNASHRRIVNLHPPSIHGDALSMGNPIPAVVGDAPFSFNDTVQSSGSTAMVKIKETRIWRPGSYRISFDMRSTIDGQFVWGIVLRNDADVGAPLRETQFHTWDTFIQDIDGWEVGDFVQVYARSTATNLVEVRNLRLFIHESDMTEAIM